MPQRQYSDQEQYARNGEASVEDAHHRVVETTAAVAGDETVRGADRHRQQHGEYGDGERDPGTTENAGQHVTTVLIGSERVRPGGRCVLELDDVELFDAAV